MGPAGVEPPEWAGAYGSVAAALLALVAFWERLTAPFARLARWVRGRRREDAESAKLEAEARKAQAEAEGVYAGLYRQLKADMQALLDERAEDCERQIQRACEELRAEFEAERRHQRKGFAQLVAALASLIPGAPALSPKLKRLYDQAMADAASLDVAAEPDGLRP